MTREEFVMTLAYPTGSLAAHPPRLSPG